MPRCKVCKKTFEVVWFNQKTCSLECSRGYYNDNPVKQLKRSPIKRKSEKRKLTEQEYKKKKELYLSLNRQCERCSKHAIEIHHKNGRTGNRLIDEEYFMSICRDCHVFLHENPILAREKGWLI